MPSAAVKSARKPAAKPAPKVRRAKAKAAPRVGIVSLGCPKALVDSERIITKLRAEGYELSPDYDGADVVVVNTCGFLDSAKEESLEAIGEAHGREWPRHRHRLHGRGGGAHPRSASRRARRHRPASVRAGRRRRARGRAAAARSLRRSRAARGPAPHAAPLRLPEDFRRLQQPLLVLHHPELARRSRQPPRRSASWPRPSGW